MLQDLQRRTLLQTPHHPNRTAAEQWAVCARPGSPCDGEEECCLLHVNQHLCVDEPGVSCVPWLLGESSAVMGASEQTGKVGVDGQANFSFTTTVFWARPHTVIAHASLGGIQWAIGKRFAVKFQSDLCPDRTVPTMEGGCERCPAGWEAMRGNGEIEAFRMQTVAFINPYCVPCQAGDYSPNGTQCLPCPPGSYQQHWARRECEPCARGTASPAFSSRNCRECEVGFYQNEVGTTACKTCPPGAECNPGENGLREQAVAEPHYFHLSGENFTLCRVPGACLGGANVCTEGMEGLLCDKCKQGFTRRHRDMVCSKCPDATANLSATIGMVVAFMAYIALSVRLKTSAGIRRGEVKSIIVKIVFNYVFLAGISFQYLRGYTTYGLFSAIETMGTLTTEPLSLVSLKCLVSYDGRNYEFITVLLALSAIPIASLIAWLLMIAAYIVRPWQWPSGMRGWLAQMTPILLVIAFVLHPAVTKIFVRFSLRCVYVEDWRLEANLEIPCYAEEHMALAVLSLFGIMVWSLGVPLVCFFVLRHYRKRLMQPDVRHMFGFLYNGFEHKSYYFECLFMLRKVLVIGSDSQTPDSRRVALLRLLVIAILSLVLQFKVSPFDNRCWRLLDHLETANIAAFGITILVALFLENQPDEVLAFMGRLLVIYCQCVYLGLIVMAFFRPCLVGMLRKYGRILPRALVHIVHKHMYIAVGAMRLQGNGLLDIHELSGSERRYLGNMFGEALEELCARKSQCSLNVLTLRQVAIVAVAEIMKDEVERKTSLDKCSNSAGLISMVLPIKALMTDDSANSDSLQEQQSLAELARQAVGYCQDHLDCSFSLEDLQEALMDVMDNIFSGNITLCKSDDDFDTVSSSIGLSVRTTPRVMAMQEDDGTDLVEVLVEATDKELAKAEGRQLESCWSQSVNCVDGVRPLDEVLSMIELSSQIMSPLRRVIPIPFDKQPSEAEAPKTVLRPSEEPGDRPPRLVAAVGRPSDVCVLQCSQVHEQL